MTAFSNFEQEVKGMSKEKLKNTKTFTVGQVLCYLLKDKRIKSYHSFWLKATGNEIQKIIKSDLSKAY